MLSNCVVSQVAFKNRVGEGLWSASFKANGFRYHGEN